jgi:hypothetical protein
VRQRGCAGIRSARPRDQEERETNEVPVRIGLAMTSGALYDMSGDAEM